MGMCMRLPVALALACSTSMLRAADKSKELPPTPALVMSDQFGEPHRLSELRGEVVVLVFADRQGAEASRALGEQLHVYFHPEARGKSAAEAQAAPVRAPADWPEGAEVPNVRLVPVACIGKVPRPLQPVVRQQFRRAVAEGALWLDMSGTLADWTGVTPAVPNVAVLDARGRLRDLQSGEFAGDRWTSLTQTIEGLQREAAEQVGLAERPSGGKRR